MLTAIPATVRQMNLANIPPSERGKAGEQMLREAVERAKREGRYDLVEDLRRTFAYVGFQVAMGFKVAS